MTADKTKLKDIILNNDAIKTELAQATSREQALSIVMRCADKGGLAVTEAEALRFLPPLDGELTDAELESVAGGKEGTIFNDNIGGGTGDDTIAGFQGADTIYGGDGDDTLWGGTGNDYIDGGKGRDDIYGGTGNDTIDGGEGRDYLKGGSGADTINGGEGRDTILGGDGDDSIDGGAGNDELVGGSGADTIDGGEGSDTIWGESGNDFISGGDGGDFLYGDNGNLDDDDTLDGGAGDDSLYGGGGDDLLTGGHGRDVFYFNDHSGIDTVTDFNPNEDRIGFPLGTDTDDITVTTHQGNTVILFGSSVITLEGVEMSRDAVLNHTAFYGES